jgi:DNA polymerase-3 subunit delta
VAQLKPVYLVCGDDDVKIDAWRTRVKRRAEQEEGPGALEHHDAASMAPDALAADLAALTFATGTRYILIDGIESWKATALDPLESALADPPPETVLVMVSRGKAPARLCKAVEKAGGEVADCAAPKPKELNRWALERAAEQNLKLDGKGVQTLVALVGGRQQRIAREVERLAIYAHPEHALSATQVAELASGEVAHQAYELGDAVVAGDEQKSLKLAEELRTMGETPSRLLNSVVRRLKQVHRAAELLEAGMRESDAPAKLGGHPWAAKQIVAAAKRTSRQALEDAICTFAQLEIDLRGGSLRATHALDEDTALSLAIVRACGGVRKRAAA